MRCDEDGRDSAARAEVQCGFAFHARQPLHKLHRVGVDRRVNHVRNTGPWFAVRRDAAVAGDQRAARREEPDRRIQALRPLGIGHQQVQILQRVAGAGGKRALQGVARYGQPVGVQADQSIQPVRGRRGGRLPVGEQVGA